MHKKYIWLTPTPFAHAVPSDFCGLPVSHVCLLFTKPPTKQPVLVDKKEVPFIRCLFRSGTWWTGLVQKSELGTQTKVM